MRKKNSNENAVDGLGGKEGTKPTILNQQFKTGDLTWVEIHNSSWWPAQVLDEGSVSAKPRKKSKNELLVRLYGTYEYMYVDASKSNSEFEYMLKRENKTMKEKFQEALEQDMSLMLPKGQSKIKLSKSKGIDCAEVSKDKKQQPELTKELSGEEADDIAPAVTISTDKEKTEGSSKRKRKLDFSKEERENKETERKASKAEAPNTKKQKVAKHADVKEHASSIVKRFPCVPSVEKTEGSSKRKRKLDFSKEEGENKETEPKASKAEDPNIKKQKVAKHADVKEHESSIVTRSPCVASVEKASSTNSVVKAPISENLEEMKAKDLEIRKIVRDIIFGGLTNPPRNQSPKVSKDAMQGDPSTAEASRMNCLNAAQKSGLKATTYSRRNKRKNEGVKGVKEVVREASEAPNSKGDGFCRSKKSNAEEVAAELPNRNLKGNCTSREDKSSHNEAQKRSTLNSKHVEKKNAKGNSKAKSPKLKAETPEAVKDTAPPAEERGSLSERQVRVMQSLALIAPAGSPFRRNGLIT